MSKGCDWSSLCLPLVEWFVEACEPSSVRRSHCARAPAAPTPAVDAMGRVHYSGVRAVGFLVYLLLVGLNLSAVGFLFRKLGSLVGLCAAPTHTVWMKPHPDCFFA